MINERCLRPWTKISEVWAKSNDERNIRDHQNEIAFSDLSVTKMKGQRFGIWN